MVDEIKSNSEPGKSNVPSPEEMRDYFEHLGPGGPKVRKAAERKANGGRKR